MSYAATNPSFSFCVLILCFMFVLVKDACFQIALNKLTFWILKYTSNSGPCQILSYSDEFSLVFHIVGSLITALIKF